MTIILVFRLTNCVCVCVSLCLILSAFAPPLRNSLSYSYFLCCFFAGIRKKYFYIRNQFSIWVDQRECVEMKLEKATETKIKRAERDRIKAVPHGIYPIHYAIRCAQFFFSVITIIFTYLIIFFFSLHFGQKILHATNRIQFCVILFYITFEKCVTMRRKKRKIINSIYFFYFSCCSFIPKHFYFITRNARFFENK